MFIRQTTSNLLTIVYSKMTSTVVLGKRTLVLTKTSILGFYRVNIVTRSQTYLSLHNRPFLQSKCTCFALIFVWVSKVRECYLWSSACVMRKTTVWTVRRRSTRYASAYIMRKIDVNITFWDVRKKFNTVVHMTTDIDAKKKSTSFNSVWFVHSKMTISMQNIHSENCFAKQIFGDVSIILSRTKAFYF